MTKLSIRDYQSVCVGIYIRVYIIYIYHHIALDFIYLLLKNHTVTLRIWKHTQVRQMTESFDH